MQVPSSFGRKVFERWNNRLVIRKRLIRVPSSNWLGFEQLEERALMAANLMGDIVPGSGSSNPSDPTNVNGTLFFHATSSAAGDELWKSDGTAAGTILVKDIQPGTAGSSPSNMANVNGTLFFRANDGTNGFELWKSDGTTAGTVLVKDIRVGAADALASDVFGRTFTNVNGTLYFTANDTASGYELWKSDGTSAGTVQVKDIRSGSSGSVPQFLTNVSGTVFLLRTMEPTERSSGRAMAPPLELH